MRLRAAQVRRLVQAAVRDRPVIIALRFGGSGRRDRGSRRIRHGAGGGGLRRFGIGLPMRNVIVVARRARPRRSARGQAACPMRPMIGRKAGNGTARPQRQAETEPHQCHREPFDHHHASRKRCASIDRYRLFGGALLSWRDCDVLKIRAFCVTDGSAGPDIWHPSASD
jgi:hypothetical protein